MKLYKLKIIVDRNSATFLALSVVDFQHEDIGVEILPGDELYKSPVSEVLCAISPVARSSKAIGSDEFHIAMAKESLEC